MPEWVTQAEAAAVLGVHPSAVPKMLRRGDLHARRRRPSLQLEEVLALAEARARAAQERMQRKDTAPNGPRPPDSEHTWPTAPVAAAILGCTVVAINARARRGQVPSATSSGRRWYRPDHLELMLRAPGAKRTERGQRTRTADIATSR